MICAKRSGFLFFMALVSLSFGCDQPGVGDPCIPEQVPSGGFLPGETYVEVNSVQCRTRACIVHEFRGGDPGYTVEDEGCDPSLNGTPGQEYCFTRAEIEDAIYCSCRCSASGESSAPTCACPSGFSCRDEVITIGDEGVVGGYCVRDP
jgi:hypothetical protein